MVVNPEIAARVMDILNAKEVDEALNNFNSVLMQISDLPPSLFIEVVASFADMISQGSVTIIVARQIGRRLIQFVDTFPDDDLVVETLQQMLCRLQSRVVAFGSELTYLRDLLAQRLMKVGDMRNAVAVLRAIPVDGHTRGYTDEYKLEICARLIDGLIALKEYDGIEAVLNTVSKLLNTCSDGLKMRFKTAQALLMDSKQKFLEAGQRYMELSIRYRSVSTEAERMAYLEHALLSAILAGAGQQRARLLTFLYRDERCRVLQAYPILEKMHNQRLISRESMESLRPLLIQYYPDLFGGDNKQQFDAILERVVVEHNMLAASQIYCNITLKNLAELLEIDTEQAESVAAQMIEEDRLGAQIDQIGGLIFFERDNTSTATANSRTQNLWSSLNQILENIEADHPDWIAARTQNAVTQYC